MTVATRERSDAIIKRAVNYVVRAVSSVEEVGIVILFHQKTLLFWGNLFEMQTRFFCGACTELLLVIMMVLLHNRPLLCGGSARRAKGI